MESASPDYTEAMADQDARLEALLNVNRSEVKAQLVEAVLVQELPTDETIRRLEMIDLMAEEAPRAIGPSRPRGTLNRGSPRPATTEPSPHEPASDAPEAADPAHHERAQVELSRRSLGPSVRTGSWLSYLVTEHAALLRFGAETRTLRSHWFPLALRLTEDLRVFLATTLPQQVLPPLTAALPAVLKRGWSVLPKLDYNLLAALADLVRLAAIVQAPQHPRGNRAWFGLLDPVVGALVLLRTSGGLPSRTLQAWNQACLKLGLADSQRAAGSESLRTLLEARSDQVSLPDAVLALAGLRARRVVELAEFVPPGGVDYFCRDSFDAAPDVQADIDRAIAGFEAQLAGFEKEGQEVLRARYFVPTGGLLTRFYRADDVLESAPWTVGLLDEVDATFRPLLVGKVTLAGGEQVMLLGNAALASTLDRLATLKEQLLDPTQARNTALAHDVARVLVSLGKTLVVVLRNRSRWGDKLIRAANPEGLTDPLPYEQDKVDLPAAWAGLSVVEALVECARVSFLAARYLGDTSLDATLTKGETLAQQAAEVLERLGRLATPQQFAAAKARWSSLIPVPEDA